MVVSEIKLYELLKARIGEREAEAFVEILENKVDKKLEEKKATFALKEDIYQLTNEMKDEMIKMKSELLKTIYLTSVGQFLAIVASVVSLLLLFLKK